MHKYILFFILASLLVPSLAMAKDDRMPLWGNSCNKLKKKYFDENSSFITFSKKPSLIESYILFELNYYGIKLLLPNDKYDDVYISKNKNEQYELFIRSSNGTIISMMIIENKLINDIYLKEKNAEEINIQNINLTKTMYGGPVRMSDLLILSYKITPKDISCEEANIIEDSAKSIALILKNTTSEGVLAAYYGVGDYDGWIEEYNNDCDIKYVLNIIPYKNSDQIFQITYEIPKNKMYHQIPFIIGSSITSNKVIHPPEWLNSLNIALVDGCNESWLKYINVANKNGISEKSLLKVKENLQIQ